MLDFKHILDTVASAFAETLWPTRCAGCDLPGELVCGECEASLPAIDLNLACPRCGAPYGWVVCTQCTDSSAPGEEGAGVRDGSEVRADGKTQDGSEARVGGKSGRRLCTDDFSFSAARSAYGFEGAAKRIVTFYKDRDERRLDSFIADKLCLCIRGKSCGTVDEAVFESLTRIGPHEAPQDWAAWADAIVTIPTSPENLRRRGYDHMQPIGRMCAERLGLSALDALRSLRSSDQRALSAQARRENRSGAFRLAKGCELPAHVLLIDDVLTTGATCSAAAQVLLEGGAHEVRVVAFARVW